MPAKPEEIIGVFEWEIKRFSNGDRPDTIIGVLEKDPATGQQIKIKGPAAVDTLDRDLSYRFYGRWVIHHKYGKQFVFSSFTLSSPYGERGTVKYLSRADGIGRRRAQQIWNLFGPDSLRIAKEHPEKVAAEVRGLTLEKAEAAQAYFKQIEALEASMIELTELLGGRGLPKRLISDAIGKWGATAAEHIREHPYELMVFGGVDFLGADKLYLDLGHPPEAIERQALCVVQSLRSSNEGHTWFEISHCRQALLEKVAGVDVNLTNALWDAFDRGLIVKKVVDDRTWVAEAKKARNEETIAECVHDAGIEKQFGNLVMHPASNGEEGPTEHQSLEISRASGKIGVLAGGPGCGKTFCLASIIQQITSGSIAVCAPTGKAAVRATESLAAQDVAIRATTIHRLLGVEKLDDGGWVFSHNRMNPLPIRYIFVDEASMIDVDLAASLLSARAAGTHVLFVGDPNQLAPVGHGAPLRDMIAAGIPTGTLTEIHRNAGRIVQCCKEIREKHTFTPSPKLDLVNGENLIVTERTSPAAQIYELQSNLERLQDSKWHPAWDTFVLVAVNKKSPLGRQALNRTLQAQLNPAGRQVAGNSFRVNDKVICLTNSLLPADKKDGPEADEDGKIYVANGEIGRVVDATPAMTIVKLDCPDRVVRVPKSQAENGDGNGSGDDATDTGCSWDLGYAITVHKSQGSEAPIVFMMIDEFPGAKRLCRREWIFTGISRAKVACIGIGRLATARGFCRTSGLGKRKTFLKELITGELT